MAATSASIDVGRYIELRRSNLRGRRPVRADRRLRTDGNPSVRNRRSCIKTTLSRPALRTRLGIGIEDIQRDALPGALHDAHVFAPQFPRLPASAGVGDHVDLLVHAG